MVDERIVNTTTDGINKVTRVCLEAKEDRTLIKLDLSAKIGGVGGVWLGRLMLRDKLESFVATWQSWGGSVEKKGWRGGGKS